MRQWGSRVQGASPDLKSSAPPAHLLGAVAAAMLTAGCAWGSSYLGTDGGPARSAVDSCVSGSCTHVDCRQTGVHRADDTCAGPRACRAAADRIAEFSCKWAARCNISRIT